MKNYKLYYHPECPFSQKVLTFIDENNIENIELLNVNDESNKKDLEEKAGKVQFPGLLIDNENIMFESDDIIEYLDKEFL